MQIQQRLWNGERLDDIVEQYSLEARRHESLPLVILNYGIHTPKSEPLSWDCRGLTLELDTWNVVARSFRRFFNYGEMNQDFNWNDFVCEHKEDGSLMILYYYRDQWRVNTRGSFANQVFNELYGKTWTEAFFEALDRSRLSALNRECSYVFEYCSPWNQVVRKYSSPELYLLTVFNTVEDFEYGANVADVEASRMGVLRPQVTPMKNIDDILAWLEDCGDPTFEGYVLRDSCDRRIKVKNAKYVALHHLNDNGNIALPKRLLPFVLSENGESDELLNYFPHLAEPFHFLRGQVEAIKNQLSYLWDEAKDISDQKAFAQHIIGKTDATGILFRARKEKRCPLEVMKEEENYLLKILK